ncbi:MAG: hypothetical protein IKN54_04405 [Lachnospiraceae bacterium]|nr:hypothetical protein [Lachnospiraceae bacterium]
MKYRKKPVVIEAEHFVKPHIGNCLDFVGNNLLKYDPVSNEYHIHTLEGAMLVRDRDYIIKGVKGEFYTCREDIFEETYEAAGDNITIDQCKADSYYEPMDALNKLDEIITEQIDISNNQVECQTLRWVLDKISELI